MGLFSRKATLALTPEAVAAVLADAGFEAAQYEGRYRVTEGFHAYRVPVTHEDRVGVSWHFDRWDLDAQEAVLAECAAALEAAGYQSEFVTEAAADYYYLVVWVEGEF